MSLKTAGFLILFLWAYAIGKEKSRKYTDGVYLTESLARFVKYTGERIEAFREPLGDIFLSFTDEKLESVGFCDALKTDGLEKASEVIVKRIPDTAMLYFSGFVKDIGKGYGESQVTLCRYTYEKLTETARETGASMKEKVRMYTFLPVFAVSIITILLI